MDGARQAHLLLRFFERRDRIAQRHVGREVEADGHGRILALVVDLQRDALRAVVRHRRQRHHGSVRRFDEDAVERVRAFAVLRIDLHHHVVLVDAGVHGRNLALSEGIVEHLIDHRNGDAEPRCGVAINNEIRAEPLILLVAVDVAQLLELAGALQQARCPLIQLVHVLVRERVLVLRGRTATADLNVLLHLQKQRRAGNARQLAAQPVDHLVGRDAARALFKRLERDEHVADVVRAAAGSTTADKGRHGADRRIVEHHLRQRLLLHAHGVEADVLRGHGAAAHAPGVLLRKESLGHDHEQVDVERGRAHGDEKHQQLMAQHPTQCAGIFAVQPVEGLLAGAIDAAMFRCVAGF